MSVDHRVVECQVCWRAYPHDQTCYVDGFGRVCDYCFQDSPELAEERKAGKPGLWVPPGKTP